MLSFNQIHADLSDQEIHWGITLFGRETDTVSPSTPASRPRAIPGALPPEKKRGWDDSAPSPPNPGGASSGSRGDTGGASGDRALGQAAIYERPDDVQAEDALRLEPFEEDLETRRNYNQF